ncbi:MAG: NYN domain-containing protein [Acaryochloridaceae cyanobacterium SU_2_1]|nr:NYN domain-containing protein [Acaryochloridaceae cyanobacterium SU_2_1]
MVKLTKPGLILGLGPLVFAIAFGLSYVTERDSRRASLTGVMALSVAYGTALVCQSETYASSSASAITTQIMAGDPPSQSIAEPREVAVFWDYENVKVAAQGLQAPLAESIVDYSQSQGHTRLKIVYSNWRREKESLVQALYSLGFEPIHVSTGKENSVDVKLTVDCLNTAYQYPQVHQFIIVTGDRDFVPLVNALKNLKKRVTLIGRAEVASDQLLLSADEFIDIEKLGTEEPDAPSFEKRQQVPKISYDDAVQCLIAAINLARNQGKSSRFGAIDRLMRANIHHSYQGIASINRGNGRGFANFSAFVVAVAEQGKVQIRTLAGFQELFLPEEDPEAESEFSSQDSGPFTREQWQLIISQVKQAFECSDPEHNGYGRFMSLFFHVRLAKKDGRLPHSNERLKQSLSRLVEVGLLIEQPNRSFRLIPNLEDTINDHLNNLMAIET